MVVMKEGKDEVCKVRATLGGGEGGFGFGDGGDGSKGL